MSSRILRHYEAICEVEIEQGMSFIAECDVTLREDGRVDVQCKIPTSDDVAAVSRIYQERHLVFARLTSKNKHRPWTMIAPRVYFSGMAGGTQGFNINPRPAEPITIKMARDTSRQVEVHYGLSNFYFLGCEATHSDAGFKLDKFRASIQNFELLFKWREDYDDAIAKLEESGKVLLTGELIVQTEVDRLEELDRVVTDVLLLLSFATGSWIGIVYRDISDDHGLIQSRFGSSKLLPYRHFDFVIDARNMKGCQLREYLERAYPAFLSTKTGLGMDIVLEWTVSAKLGSHLEIKYLITDLALEALASRIPEYLQKKGVELESGALNAARTKIPKVLAQRKEELPSAVIDEIASAIAFKEVGLRDRLRALLQHQRIAFQEDELEFTQTRARLIHTGRFRDPGEAMAEYQRLTNFVNRILLSLLECHGIFYFNVARGYVEERVPAPL